MQSLATEDSDGNFMPAIGIGKLGALGVLAAINVQTVRYHKGIRTIDPLWRADGGRRLYGPKSLSRLKFILHASELGFGVDEVRELLKLSGSL